MMPGLGLPELFIVAVISLFSVVPLAASVWALVMLFQLRRDQAAMKDTLARIEQQLRR
jgi:hypothetical protein